MLDHFIAKNATAHKVNAYYTLAISYWTFCVGKHTILGTGIVNIAVVPFQSIQQTTITHIHIDF